jgi:hypothetical protein
VLPALKLESLVIQSSSDLFSESFITALSKSTIRHLAPRNISGHNSTSQLNSLASALPRLHNLVSLDIRANEHSASSLAVLLRSLSQSPVRSLSFAGFRSAGYLIGLKLDELKLSTCYDLVKDTNLSFFSIALVEKPKDDSPLEFTLSTAKGLCSVVIRRCGSF